MSKLDKAQIEKFLHTQVACWNSSDRDGFFASYREVAPNDLHIEYVGKHAGDGWQILEGMWEKSQPVTEVEELALLHCGDEVACHNRNHIKGTGKYIDTIELYHFGDNGDVRVRYFIGEQP